MKAENEILCTELVETTEDIPYNVRDSELLGDAATSDGSPILESDADNSWERQLDKLKEKIEELQENYDQSYLEIGRLLIQARDVYKGHGDWIRWLKGNVPFSVRHAQRLIRVAEMFDNDNATLVSRLGLTSSKAYTLTRVGKNDIDHFLGTFFRVGGKTKVVTDMTKRELELAVTTFLRSKLASTNHEGVTSNQGTEAPKESVESNLKKLKEVLSRTIASIRDSDSDTRSSWIAEIENLYKAGLDELAPESV